MKDWVDQLVAERRAFLASIAGEERLCAAEDAGRLRDALGVAVPVGLPRSLHRVGARPGARPRRPLRPHPRPVPRAARRRPLRAWRRSRCGPRSERARASRAGSCAASSGPTASSASGATTTCSASSGGGRSPRCARRWSRSTPRTLARFLPRWHGIGTNRAGRRRARRRGGPAAGRAAGGVGARPRHPPGPPARTTSRPTSTPSARRATWCGSAPVPSAPPTAASASPSATRPGCCCRRVEGFEPDAAPHRAARPPRRSAARRSGPTSPAPPSRPASPSTTPPCWPRSGTWCGRASSPTTRSPRCVPSSARSGVGRPAASTSRTGARGRPRPGRLARLGPAGRRRPLVARRARCSSPLPTATEAAHARALQLLERYGVLTREAALGEGAEGGFAGVYPVLKALEERGQVRRGYFVAGLGAAQFAVAGRGRPAPRRAQRRRRRRRSCWRPPTPPSPSARRSRGPSSDGPPGPRRGRAGGAGRAPTPSPTSSGAPTRCCASPPPPTTTAGPTRSVGSWTTGRFRSLEIRAVDGVDVHEAAPEVREALQRAGFQQAYKGWSRRSRP